MIPNAIIRQYAVGQQVDAEVAGQDVVLHYMLALLNEAGLIGTYATSRSSRHGPTNAPAPATTPRHSCGRFSPRTSPGPSSKAWCRGACKKTTTASAPRSANGSASSPNAPTQSGCYWPTRPPTASTLLFASCAMRPALGQ